MGGTSFKEASFTAAAAHIRNLHTEGAIKTAAHCKTKWSSVSTLMISGFLFLPLILFHLVESAIQHSRTTRHKLRGWRKFQSEDW